MLRAGLREVDADGAVLAEASTQQISQLPGCTEGRCLSRHADEVCTVMDVARREGVRVTARAQAHPLPGTPWVPGLLLDFSRHRAARARDAKDRSALVEPGAVLDSVTAAASAFGLRFGPDPSTHSRATIGGSIGNNVCGSRALRYGRTADNIETLDVVLSSGERIQCQAFRSGGSGRGRPRRSDLRWPPWSTPTAISSATYSAGSAARSPVIRSRTSSPSVDRTWRDS